MAGLNFLNFFGSNELGGVRCTDSVWLLFNKFVTMLIIVGFIWYTAAQPQISADGETLTLTGQTIAFEVDGGRTTVETLLNKGYDKATMDEMINELRSDMKTIVDANSDKVTKLESMLSSTKAELDTAKQERDEMAGKLRLLQAHADSDCRADQVGFFFDAAQVWEEKHHMAHAFRVSRTAGAHLAVCGQSGGTRFWMGGRFS